MAYIHFQQPNVDAAVAILWATATTCSSQVNTVHQLWLFVLLFATRYIVNTNCHKFLL